MILQYKQWLMYMKINIFCYFNTMNTLKYETHRSKYLDVSKHYRTDGFWGQMPCVLSINTCTSRLKFWKSHTDACFACHIHVERTVSSVMWSAVWDPVRSAMDELVSVACFSRLSSIYSHVFPVLCGERNTVEMTGGCLTSIASVKVQHTAVHHYRCFTWMSCKVWAFFPKCRWL